MIDTDKYKGHTPVRKEWPRWCEDWLYSIYNRNALVEIIPNWNQDNNLACDAPLILQAYEEKCKEVKRLRERLIRAYDWVEKVVHGDDSVMADYTEYVCGDEEE